MRWLYKLPLRFRSLFRRNHVEQDLSEELRFHYENLKSEFIWRGLTPQDAHYAAMRELGGTEQIKEECRDVRRVRHIENFFQDARFALRMLRKNPGFMAVVVITLALGIGANTVVFSLINTTVLHALPYPQSEKLVVLYRAFGNTTVLMSIPDFRDVESQTRTFESMGLYHFDPEPTLTGADAGTTLNNVRVSPDLFKVFRVTPLLGRTFLSSEAEPGKDQVLIVSFSFWREHLGGDRAAIGKTIVVGRSPRTIVGVMRPEFTFPNQFTDTWTPEPSSSYTDETLRNAMNCAVIGRLKYGVSPREAQAEMDRIAARLGKAHPPLEGAGLKVVSLQEQTAGPVEKMLFMLFGAVGLVLLIACTNVANLVLARNARRRREFAVRSLLGATSTQLMWPLLAESLVLALLGGCVAVVLAFGGIQVARGIAPRNIPRLDEVGIDGWVLLFTLLLSLLTGVVLGVMPAFRATKTSLIAALKEGSSTSYLGFDVGRPSHLPRVIAVLQVALAVVLLFGAGLLLRSFTLLLSVPLGFDPRNLLTAQLVEGPRLHRGDRGTDSYQQVLDEVGTLAGVQSAALASGGPLGGGQGRAAFSMDLNSKRPSGQNLFRAYQEDLRAGREAEFQVVTPSYFATMGIPILRGRGFADQDRDGSAGVIIINQAMARRFWPGQNPLGKRIDVNEGTCLCEVIGVAGDARDVRLETEPQPEIYRPRRQEHSGNALLIRTGIAPLALRNALEDRIRGHGIDVRITRLTSMPEVISDSVISPRFHTSLLSLFAGLALLLAAVGTFGVVATSVNRRNHEMGIRLALGAQPSDVFRLVLGEGMSIAFLGIPAGLAAAGCLSRLISGLLYGVTPTDPQTLLEVAMVMTLVVMMACYLPARRATKVDPMVALRYE